MEFKDFKELVDTKLEKLIWIDFEDSTIISKEGFSVSLDYYKNIGENKDKIFSRSIKKFFCNNSLIYK